MYGIHRTRRTAKMNNKDISNKNNKGQYHGYQQTILYNQIADRGNAKHGQPIGYMEIHKRMVMNSTNFYIR